MTLFVLSAILSVKSNSMGKALDAVIVSLKARSFIFRFPQDEERKSQWIAAMGRKD